MNREEKQQEVQALADAMGKSQVTVLADFTGLTVEDLTTFRKSLRGANTKAKVVKNNLVKLAAGKALKDSSAADLEKLTGLLVGPNIALFGLNDPVASAKAITAFAKGKENLKIKGGWFEGRFLDKAGIEQLAKMPSREELFAKLLALINAPATQLLRLMQAPATQLTRTIDAWRAKLEQKGA